MRDEDRVERWLADLASTLEKTAALVARGRSAFDGDEALPLAFEALSNRVGDLATRLVKADAGRFADPIWSQAARHGDFVAHHDDRIDRDLLWRTVTTSFPVLADAVRAARQ